MSTHARLGPGSTIADFRIESLVRSAGIADVYAAEQSSLGRPVTLMVCPARSGERFAEAARRLAAFEHPSVLAVYAVGRADDVLFAATAMPQGRSLDAIVGDGALAPTAAAEVAERLAAALEALTDAGVGPIEPSAREVFVGPANQVQVAALETLTTSTGEAAESAQRVLADLAGAAPAPTRSSRVWIGAAVAVVAAATAAVVAIVASNGNETSKPAVAVRAPVDAPVARLVATIPVSGTPGSMAVGEGSIWVATLEGNVLRIDPRTNRVSGAPIRFARNDQRNNVTVRIGADAVFAADGNRGRIARIDPRSARVTARRTLGGVVSGATVDGGVVWVLHWHMRGPRPVDELLRLDATTLRPLGRPTPIGAPVRIGPQASDVEAAGGVAWVTNGVAGTVMRFDSQTGKSTTVRVGAKPVDSALVDGTLWVPDVWSGALTPLDARAMRLPETAIQADYPFSVAATGGSLWVLAQTHNEGPGGAERLYRIDPRTRTILGRPIDVGADLGWIAAGAGGVWVRSSSKRAVMRFAATSPAPAARPAKRSPGEPRPMTGGPLRAGTWTTSRFMVPLTFSVGEGWVGAADNPTGMSLVRTDDVRVEVDAYAPPQVFTPAGKVRRLRTPSQAVQLVTANPHLVVSGRRRTSVGGVPATQLDVRVRPYRPYPDFCATACVVLFGMPANSIGAQAGIPARLWFLQAGGRTVVVSAEVEGDHPDLAIPEAVVRSLRFR